MLMSGTVSALRNEPTPTIDETDIQAFHSIDDASLALYAGQNALQNGRYEEALEHYTNVTRFNPSWLAAWYLKAFGLKKLNRTEESLVAVNKALALESSDRDSNNLKADILEKTGRSDEAVIYRSKAKAASVTLLPDIHPIHTQEAPMNLSTLVSGLVVLMFLVSVHKYR